MNIKHVMGYSATTVVAFGIGIAAGSGGGSDVVSAAEPSPAATVTATATKTVRAEPAAQPTATVTVPGPTVTTTKVTRKPAKTVTVKVTPKPKSAIPGDGTYEVGVDIKPGTYVSPPPSSGNCYWARLSGSNSLDSIIANNNSSGQSLVTIASTDKFFETSGCNDWSRR